MFLEFSDKCVDKIKEKGNPLIFIPFYGLCVVPYSITNTNESYQLLFSPIFY